MVRESGRSSRKLDGNPPVSPWGKAERMLPRFLGSSRDSGSLRFRPMKGGRPKPPPRRNSRSGLEADACAELQLTRRAPRERMVEAAVELVRGARDVLRVDV